MFKEGVWLLTLVHPRNVCILSTGSTKEIIILSTGKYVF